MKIVYKMTEQNFELQSKSERSLFSVYYVYIERSSNYNRAGIRSRDYMDYWSIRFLLGKKLLIYRW